MVWCGWLTGFCFVSIVYLLYICIQKIVMQIITLNIYIYLGSWVSQSQCREADYRISHSPNREL